MRTIRFGYTPDSDDAFHYHALEAGLIPPPKGTRFEFVQLAIQTLNEKALRGDLEVSAISSIFYPQIADRYAVLSAGSSVGRAYGPALVARQDFARDTLEGRRVAVPGRFTTGFFLLNYFYGGFEPVFLPFDEIAAAVEGGEADAGVLIHEELLNYRLRGLKRLACLGNRWFEETGLPLPVGLTAARRDLGAGLIADVRSALERSMRHAIEHPAPAMAFASAFASGKGEVTAEFVSKFANRDTERMPADVRKGLEELYRRAHARGLISRRPELEIL